MEIPAYDLENPEANILRDLPLAGTPLRGLVVRGEFCLLAYVGVPEEHWLADMDELEFPCHFGINFRGLGDGRMRPQGWYWYGWDYGHCTDLLLPHPVLDVVLPAFPGARARSVAEVEEDVLDAALSLWHALEEAQAVAKDSLRAQVRSSGSASD